jgi:NAD(P)-dependent dehydrogenase (short-subunit alcohol dehydrogenase family)
MDLRDRVVVVTGGAGGIGRALCRRFAAEGAAGVVVSDLDEAGTRTVADEVGGLAVPANVAVEAEVANLVRRALDSFGRIDLFCSNAGILYDGGPEVPNEKWQRIWEVNVMSHLYVARAVLPGMLERGEGYLLGTISAAALLNHLGAMPYAVTKAAALSLFEWLAINHGDDGIRVSCVCPQGVRTAMIAGEGASNALLAAGALAPEEVATSVLEGVRAERFLILPHPEVAEYFQRKAGDYDRWLKGMRRLKARTAAAESGAS